MDTRIARTIKELESHGWTLKVSDQKLHWWIDEAYELSSIWSPIGAKLFLTTDVDPGATSNRKKGESIISISLTKKIPATRLSSEPFTLYLSQLNDKGIKELIKVSQGWRDEIGSIG